MLKLKRISTILLILLFAFTVLSSGLVVNPAFSEDTDELEQQLEETEAEKALKEKILTETQGEINTILNSSWSVSQKIAALEDQINGIENDIKSLTKEIASKEVAIKEQSVLIGDKEFQVESISRRLYKNSRFNFLDFFIAPNDANDMMRSYILKKYTLNNQLDTIELLNIELGDLQVKREELSTQQGELEAENEALDESKAALASEKERLSAEVAARNAAKGKLQNEISLLNDKITDLQEAILLARSGAYTPSVGSVPTGSDYYASAEAFRTKAPSGSFAVFSFGAYTHRLGMSQYGAQGRAEAGQNYKQIISAYLGKAPVSKDTSGNISVEGYGDMNFESTYLYGIAEMPSSWHVEALKAQAVLARSFAYKYKSAGNTICTTQSCQVFLKSKSDNPPAAWKKAVDDTKGMIVLDAPTYYSSTTGGYLSSSGWDTTDGVGGGNWTERAYESLAGSPWFYKSWYRNGIYDTSPWCSKSNPWLSTAEMADIINTWLVMTRNGVTKTVDDGRILPVSVQTCSYSGFSGNPYSMTDMKGLLSAPVTEIYGYPDVSISSSGQTTSVSFSTNRGVVSIPGMDFKAAYNTRAPGYLSIPQSSWGVDFTLVNVERVL